MATYRLIHRVAGTGERSSGLNHLQFRVWTQYQLSADDYGVCPAEAAKLQGDNVALAEEPARRIQAAIEVLIAVHLVETFMDGKRRYLYQPDWQDRQRIKWPTETSQPPIPAAELAKCSPSTRALLAKRFPSSEPELSSHAGARNAPANANATANAELEEGSGETPIERQRGQTLITSPKSWFLKHGTHVGDLCDWKCFAGEQADEFARQLPGIPFEEAQRQVITWAQDVRRKWQADGRIPADRMFEFWAFRWAETHGSSKPGAGGVDVLAGLR